MKAAAKTLAEQSDKHLLYQQSVQDVEAEIDFVDAEFRRLTGRLATRLREDFCGTGNTAAEWVRRRPENMALGLDLDDEVLAWGRVHNLGDLPEEDQWRLILEACDVRQPPDEPMDIVLAMNFSYYLFPTRQEMVGYFTRVRKSLVTDGVFFLDAYGGYDSYREIQEEREVDGFTYVWDQADYDPVTGMMQCHIHFHFPDGSKISPAFSYRWRLWTLPEITEMLAEAGFSDVQVYWEGTDEETGEGNGEFNPCERGDPDPGWITYISAR